ncbi:MAG: GGDEF domain-containing protein [bacterium]|nr:GGDEF domain-containing protein [bacterium]
MTSNEIIKCDVTRSQACDFILSLQAATELKSLWMLFLEGIRSEYDLVEAKLIYKTEILFKSLVFQKDKLTIEEIEEYNFIESGNTLDFFVSGNTIIATKQNDTYRVQIELRFSQLKNVPNKQQRDELFVVSRIFINRLVLILKLENYELQSLKDDITKTYNQNYLKEYLQNEIERGKRYPPANFSVVFFDLDNLKAVNEAYGHLVGTSILKEVANLLRQQVRKIDFLSRFGGDEFVIILVKTPPDSALEICERLKDHLTRKVFLKERNINLKMTGCFGISAFPQDGDTVDELIRKADSAMYDVKHKGKNGIKIYEGD